MESNQKQKTSKRNMHIFPIYKKLAWDYLFFYTIDFLFLTQIKKLSASDVVLTSTIYSFFCIIMQIPANIIVEFLGRKKSIVLGNTLNCIYMLLIMTSKSLYDIMFAEFISSIAFGIKEIAEPSLLNESIPASRYKNKIFAKISAKGASGYYLFNAVSKIISGYMFTINPYLPIIFSLIILIIATILSIMFIEPVKKEKNSINDLWEKIKLKDLKIGISFVLQSERLKALILANALLSALLTVLADYYISLFEDLNISAFIIGIIGAFRKFNIFIIIKKTKYYSI